ncbi:hypothetical protein ISN44_As07g015390 [Arabidopsis suecica]|uniref:Uncharacterized protein n=1 Tax=Arabidopsis suecica TaxID=45249 RepID=A0A8T2BTC9_ARASU|nr:hypothetical protein ISN44_As07g015390 [Arabidopsis suecica]
MFYFASKWEIFFYDSTKHHRLLMILIYGDLLETLSTTDQENMVKEVLKVGTFTQLISTFFGGFAFVFIRGLQLAFVLLSCINFSVDVQVIASRIGSSRFSKLL